MTENGEMFGVQMAGDNVSGGGDGGGGRMVLRAAACVSGDRRGEQEESVLSMVIDPEIGSAAAAESSPHDHLMDDNRQQRAGRPKARCPCGVQQLSKGNHRDGLNSGRGSGRVGGGGNNIVALNVGGQLFQTSIETLSYDRNSMLTAMVTRHHLHSEDEAIFIDRDPVRFRHVLNYLRSRTIWSDALSDLRAIQEEADFFNLSGLYDLCEGRIQEALCEKNERVTAQEQTRRAIGEEMKETMKAFMDLENAKSNQHRKEPMLGMRKRRSEYETDFIFRMDENF